MPAASVLAVPQGGVPASGSFFHFELRSGRVTGTCPEADDGEADEVDDGRGAAAREGFD